jgi:nucleotide-binding universal stress UspA family protein
MRERIVKVGNPSSKMRAGKEIDVDLIVMGRTGIGNSQVEVGHVTIKVLRLTSKPVVMFK